jgi:hypothetical protein
LEDFATSVFKVKNGSSKVFQNSGILPQHYIATTQKTSTRVDNSKSVVAVMVVVAAEVSVLP